MKTYVELTIISNSEIYSSHHTSCLIQHPLKMVTCKNNVCNIDAYLLGHPKLYVATLEITNWKYRIKPITHCNRPTAQIMSFNIKKKSLQQLTSAPERMARAAMASPAERGGATAGGTRSGCAATRWGLPRGSRGWKIWRREHFTNGNDGGRSTSSGGSERRQNGEVKVQIGQEERGKTLITRH